MVKKTLDIGDPVHQHPLNAALESDRGRRTSRTRPLYNKDEKRERRREEEEERGEEVHLHQKKYDSLVEP